MDDWGVGCYEDTAAELAPAAEAAVGALGLTGGERVLDVACGTGNAASLAAAAGADVTGLDASPRLLDVAGDRVPGGAFVLGDAAALPFADGEFDAAVSVFGVIFAHPAGRAADELARVVRPGGRAAVTTWPPRGPLFAAVSLMRAAVERRRPTSGRPPVTWGDPAVIESLLGPYGELTIGEHELSYEESRPEDLWDRWERLHPMWIRARGVLEPAGEWNALREACLATMREAGVGAGATSPYLLAVLERR
ncbi:MAG: class I SAM-dependent methyltransferase [Solirubrobacteraceae bacterium]